MSEAKRILKPKGRLLVRILSGDQEHAAPKLSGSGAPVQFVPAKDDIVSLIANAELSGIRLLKYDDPPCFVHDGIKMLKPTSKRSKREALSNGPLPKS